MTANPRKLVIALLVLAPLLLIYLLYTRLDGGDDIDLTVRERVEDTRPRRATPPSDANTGRIGGIGVGTVRQTQFFHKNERGVVDREFGFDELLHRQGDQWEITKPYMRLFLPGFRCHVTANRGQVHCETALSGPVPGDAMFSGNVVIHVMPNEPNDLLAETYIYLDDVAFIAEQSLFATSGPIKFVSRVGQLVGRGLELVYDQGRNRLERFRIQQLESLRLRSADLLPLATTGRNPGAPGPRDAGPAQPTEPADANRPAIAGADVPIEPASDLYECVFWKNVRIETPEQIVAARRWLTINNILWSNSNAAAPETAAVASPPGPEQDPPDVVPYPGPNALDTSPSSFVALSSLPESAFDVVVTCDGGFVVGPKGIGTAAPEPNETTAVALDAEVTPELGSDPNRQTLYAEQIDVDAATSDIDLAGPVQIGFVIDVGDLTGRPGEPVPMTVTAQDAVRFLAATNQIHLQGDCTAMLRQTVAAADGTSFIEEYALSAPTLALDLIQEPNVSVRRLATSGGWVSVHGVRRIGDETSGWVLEGTRLDGDITGESLVLIGPGQLSVHNPQSTGAAADPNADAGAFSLRQPCIARMKGFERLTYSTAAQRIVAASNDWMELSYLPILDDGSYGPVATAYAGHIEVLLEPTPDDRVELDRLIASQGILYEDDTQQFAGSRLTYEHGAGRVRVTGDAAWPCYYNDVPVDQIDMDLSGRNASGQIQNFGTLQIR